MSKSEPNDKISGVSHPTPSQHTPFLIILQLQLERGVSFLCFDVTIFLFCLLTGARSTDFQCGGGASSLVPMDSRNDIESQRDIAWMEASSQIVA